MDEEKTAEKQRQADEEAKEAGKEGGADPVEPVYKYEPKTTVDWAVQNDNKPLWTRSPKEVRPTRASARRPGPPNWKATSLAGSSHEGGMCIVLPALDCSAQAPD